jgi:dihydroxyacetone kinase
MRKLTLLALVTVFLSPAAFAEDGLDQADSIALKDLETMMTNPALRANAIKGDSSALQVDAQVKALTGGDKQKEEQMYKVANEVFAKIAKEEGGDMEKIQARLNAYMKNPDSLGLTMTESQKAAVRELSSKAK